MITDKERHERAKKFRDMISAREYGIPGKVGSFVEIDDLLSELLDRRVYYNEVDIDACEATGIADLIDRPTCTIVCECDAYSSFGERIDGMRIYELSCGHQAIGYEKPMYCHKCGAVITDANR